VSLDPELARLAAVSETVERYVSLAPAPAHLLRRGPYAELPDAAVHPRRFALHSDRQCRRTPGLQALTESKVADWCWAHSLTGLPTLVPAALVYLRHSRRPPNNFVAEATTTGIASHVSLSHAVLNGLCEVLERDALTIAWLNSLRLRALDPAGTRVADLLSGPLARSNYAFSIFSIPSDFPFPVVLAHARRKEGHPRAAVGVACRPSPTEAAQRALLEVTQVILRLSAKPSVPPTRIRTIDDHGDFYATERGAGLLDEKLEADSTRMLSDVPRGADVTSATELTGAVQRLAGSGLEVLVVELTTADAASAGYRVVRVVVPGTLDMSGDPRWPRLGGERLYDLPVHLGLRPKRIPESRLNRLPIPLA
jgi:ribosomal protein S12 methylthiotransferase accessory factor